MLRLILVCATLVGLVGSCGGDGGSCSLPEQWSSARSGDLCQVNFFTQPEYAVYCGGSTGSWHCACGPIVDNPPEFDHADFCDLDPPERACVAIEQCGFPL